MAVSVEHRLKRILPIALIAALAAVQAWFGHGDAGAAGGGCEPFTGDPSQPMTELLKPPPAPEPTKGP